jgi:hypothetical protein
MGLQFKQTQIIIPNADESQYAKELLQTWNIESFVVPFGLGDRVMVLATNPDPGS